MPQRVNAVEPFLRAVLKVITCDGTQLLEDNNIRGVKAVVLLGDPGSEIVKYANDQQADLGELAL